jgi:hypothetical protein
MFMKPDSHQFDIARDPSVWHGCRVRYRLGFVKI